MRTPVPGPLDRPDTTARVPWRQPLLPLAGAALALLLFLRTLALLAGPQPPEDVPWLPGWALETAGLALLMLATVAACGWWADRLRRRERAQERAAHRTEMGLLAGGLAHELRNTLNAMHSQLALLRKHLATGAAGQALRRTDQLERAVTDLEGLVGEFLTFARPAQDQLEDVDVAALVHDVLDFVALDLEQAQVTLVTEIAPALPPLRADAGKLERALLNLVINARQAMPAGGTLTVRARPTERGEVLIEVQDTGCGIPEEDWPRVFQSFFSTKPGGIGLGLAIVRRTIEDLGGRIRFTSQVGQGTTFHITLPAVAPACAPRKPRLAGQEAAT